MLVPTPQMKTAAFDMPFSSCQDAAPRRSGRLLIRFGAQTEEAKEVGARTIRHAFCPTGLEKHRQRNATALFGRLDLAKTFTPGLPQDF